MIQAALCCVAQCLSLCTPIAEGRESSFTGADSISLKKIVDMFYDKVLASPELAPFFASIDMQKLKKHQVRAAWADRACSGHGSFQGLH